MTLRKVTHGQKVWYITMLGDIKSIIWDAHSKGDAMLFHTNRLHGTEDEAKAALADWLARMK